MPMPALPSVPILDENRESMDGSVAGKSYGPTLPQLTQTATLELAALGLRLQAAPGLCRCAAGLSALEKAPRLT